MRDRRKFQWGVWWYATIAVGFGLLALDRLLLHDRPIMVALRAVLACGFGLLAYAESRSRR